MRIAKIGKNQTKCGDCVPKCSKQVVNLNRVKGLFWAPVAAAVYLALSADSVAQTTTPQSQQSQTISFDIARQPADEALIAFANQAQLTIVFPYNKVRHSMANSVKGNYPVAQAITMLLAGTDLMAEVTDSGRIKVSVKPDDEESSGLFRWISDLFAKRDDLLSVPVEDQQALVEYIEVRGLRARTAQSLAIKRDADYLLETIQSVEMGKFPDQNLAEALQRVSGVAIDRAEGEGRYVTVRGFGPEFNRVLINGRQLATDTLGREFSFDTLASELVSNVTVFKQNQASQQSGGIGATIDIITDKPLSYRGMRAAGSVEMQYDDNADQWTPQGSVLMRNTFLDHKLGVLLSLTHHQRDARIDEAQIDGWLVNTNVPASSLNRDTDTLYVPRNYDQRVRFDDRSRTGGTLVLQYRPNDSLDITADYLGSRFDVNTSATSMGHWFTSSNLEAVELDDNGTAVKFSQQEGHATDFHARTFNRDSTLHAGGINIDWQVTDFLSLNSDLSMSRATSQDKQGSGNALSLIGYLNRSTFDHTNNVVLPAIYGFQTANPAQVNAEGEVVGVGDYLDPANGRSHVMLKRGWDVSDTVKQWKVDGRYLLNNEGLTQVDFGWRVADQTKQNTRYDNELNARHCAFCGYFDTPDIPDSFQTLFNAGDDFLDEVSGHDGIPNQWLRHNGPELFAFLEQAGGVDLSAVRRNNSFVINEKTYALYADLTYEWDFSSLFVVAHTGLRLAHTDVEVSGVNEQLDSLVILDKTELAPITGAAAPVNYSQSYTNWLPSIQVKATYRDKWVLRGAYSHSITRPTLSQMTPGITFTTTRQGGDLRASVGNPLLQPFESRNLDIALEYYYQKDSYLAAAAFRKYVDNFILSANQDVPFPGVTDPSTGDDPNAPDEADSTAVFDIVSPVNGQTAMVDGIEVSWQHAFGDSGFGVQANVSAVSSNAELDKDDVKTKFALTGLSGAGNLVLFYEKGPLQWRVAYNRRGGFLQSLVQSQSNEPTFVNPYQQWDVSASYQLNGRVTLYAEGINLTNETVHKHGRFNNQLLLVQDSGARYVVGVRATY